MTGYTVKHGELVRQTVGLGAVIIFQGTRYKIVKEKQVNWLIQREDGQEFNLRMTANVTLAEDQTWVGPKEKTEWDLYQESKAKGLELGVCVRLASVENRRKYPGTYVVIALPASGKIKMVKLGGDGGRYLHGFRPNDVTVVDPHE